MNTGILFRKKSPLTDWGMPWLKGGEEHTHTASRNSTGKASVSALLARALVACVSGAVESAALGSLDFSPEAGTLMSQRGILAHVESHSQPGKTGVCWVSWQAGTWTHAGFPHGAPDKATYHLGVLAVLDAMLALGWDSPLLGNPVWDFWGAYLAFLEGYEKYGLVEGIKPLLLRAADELYYWLVYRDSIDNRLLNLETHGPVASIFAATMDALPVNWLSDAKKLSAEIAKVIDVDRDPTTAAPTTTPAVNFGGFVGEQGPTLDEAVRHGDNCLLAGPTGTGKTYLTEIVAQRNEYSLVEIKGMEGLTDLDVIGAILPQEDGSRRWVDGPLVRAMRMARYDPVILFVDEINRIPREQVNLFIGMMNPKPRALCELQGIPVAGDGPFYTLEIPMTSEIVWCPTAHLTIVAAGNFGRDYAVYDLDPALRRRFDTVIEFDYLPFDLEGELVIERTGLDTVLAAALVKVAGETRRLYANGELPGAVDTASLLNWAQKCARSGADTVQAVMAQARLTWADLVVGRDHTGRINQGSFDALVDYLESLGSLPKGAA